MKIGRSFRFTNALVRSPARSIADGLRAHGQPDPDHKTFMSEHDAYVDQLRQSGLNTTILPSLEDYPDSVFIEDAALCFDGVAVVLRPGAPSRRGEAPALLQPLGELFSETHQLGGEGFVDGGDILLTDTDAFIGLSERTNRQGISALELILARYDYTVRVVETPPGVLHFKSACGLLDSETIFATRELAATGCFQDYRVIVAPDGEGPVANLVRVNDDVIMRSGFPKSELLLKDEGYSVKVLCVGEAAKVDGGLSCMSLRFTLD
ncbi:MAG: amidinotransferase [marine bacterium B5-7]|nr:MAG: amidinotransferase [marine bacterium B5-7]